MKSKLLITLLVFLCLATAGFAAKDDYLTLVHSDSSVIDVSAEYTIHNANWFFSMNPKSDISVDFFLKNLGQVNPNDVLYDWTILQNFTNYKVVSEYNTVCNNQTINNVNGTHLSQLICNNIQTGSHLEYYEDWQPFNISNLPVGDSLTVNVIGKRKANQPVDNVINIAGVGSFSQYVWWNNTWLKKQKLQVLGNIVANSSIQFVINQTGDFNANFSDLRFLNSSETAELPYWLENYTATNATVWVRTDNNQDIYMYYNNPLAKQASNISAAFYIGDDFSSVNNYLSQAIWNTTSDGVLSIINNFNSSNGTLHVEGIGSQSLKSRLNVSGNFTFRTKVKISGAGNSREYFGFWAGHTGSSDRGDPTQGLYIAELVSGGGLGTSVLFSYNTSQASDSPKMSGLDASFFGIAGGGYNGTGGFDYVVTNPNAYSLQINDTNLSFPNSSVSMPFIITGRTGLPMGVDFNYITAYPLIQPTPTINFTNSVSTLLSVNAVAPPSGFNSTNIYLNFTCNSTSINGLSNLTFNLFNGAGGLVQNTTHNVLGLFNSSNFSSTLASGNYSWDCIAIDSNNVSLLSQTNLLNVNVSSNFNVTLGPYNQNAIEFTNQNFSATLDLGNTSFATITPTFNYAGTVYTTGSGIVSSGKNYNISLNLPIQPVQWNASNQFFWNFSINYLGENFSLRSDYTNQTFYQSLFNICDNSNFTNNIFNITFKDEATNLYINGSIDSSQWSWDNGVRSLSYSNLVNNFNYSFCIYPTFNPSLQLSNTMQYSSTQPAPNPTYPARKYSFDNVTYNNISNGNITLYLLSSTQGIYTTFQIITVGNAVIPGAHVIASRVIGGVPVIISSGDTDSSGTISMFLDSNFAYTITVSKDGFDTATNTVTPTQPLYTITLTSTNGVSGIFYTDALQGLRYTKFPASGPLSTGVYNFSLSIITGTNPIQNCTMEILNSSGTIFGSATGCNSTGGTISAIVNFTNISLLLGNYYVDINGSRYVIEGDARWVNLDTSDSAFSDSMLIGLNQTIDSPMWGTNPQTADFSKIVFFFLMMAILVAVINFYTGYDTAYPGAILYLVTGIVLILSTINGPTGHGFFFLQGATNFKFFCGPSATMGCLISDIIDNWLLGFHLLLVAGIYFFTTARRYQS